MVSTPVCKPYNSYGGKFVAFNYWTFMDKNGVGMGN